MKKVIWMFAAVLITAPVFAQSGKDIRPEDRPAMGQRHEAFQEAYKAQMEQMEASKKEAEKLVQEYNELQPGKQKDAKKTEIEAFVTSVREKQLDFNEKQLNQFEKRLKDMKGNLAKEKSKGNKKAWVSDKTNKLIESNGDMRVLFDRAGKGPRLGEMRHGMKRPHFGKDGKCPFAKDGKKCEEGKDCKCGKHRGFFKRGPRVGINPPPEPVKEVK